MNPWGYVKGAQQAINMKTGPLRWGEEAQFEKQ